MAGEMKKIKNIFLSNNNDFQTNVPLFQTEQGNNVVFPFSPPIYQTKVSENLIKDLLFEGDKLTEKDNDHRHKLAGNMKRGYSRIYNDEYSLRHEDWILDRARDFIDCFVERLGEKLVNALIKKDYDRLKSSNGTLRLDTMWINYQRAGDFNPSHNHKGVLSFVIFCKVPPRIFTENAVSNSQEAGKIIFNHGYGGESFMAGNQYPITPYDGLMLMFPAKLEHHVPPFWTDDIRVSVSGNLVAV